jgi:hypothetical protein
MNDTDTTATVRDLATGATETLCLALGLDVNDGTTTEEAVVQVDALLVQVYRLAADVLVNGEDWDRQEFADQIARMIETGE